MPEPDTIPVSASVASSGKGLRYVGNWVYAYSGPIQAANENDVTMLDFTTGSGIIKAKLQFESDSFVQQVYYFRVRLNDFIMMDVIWDTAPDLTTNLFPLYLIIPPLTRVKVSWGLTNDTKNGYAILTGRVYGV